MFNLLLNYKVAHKGNGADVIHMGSSQVFFWKVKIVFCEESSHCIGQI